MDVIALAGKGDQVSADTLNRIAAEIAARSVVRGAGTLVQQRSNGTVLARRPSGLTPASRSRAQGQTHPFKVIDASTTGPAAAKVRVIFGQVNSVTPEIATVALDNDPAPTLTVVTGVVYLKLYLDVDANVSGVDVESASSLPASDSTHAYITLATVTVASDAVTAINQSVTQSLQFLRCNDHDVFGGV